jgi:two-component system sensor histidine kinase UhpB
MDADPPMTVSTIEAAAVWRRWRHRLLGGWERLDLKTRLSMSMGLLLFVVLAVAVGAVLRNAAHAVQSEIETVMRLAENVVDRAWADAGAPPDAATVQRLLAVLDESRHLCVAEPGHPDILEHPTGSCPATLNPAVPGWFAERVRPQSMELRRQVPVAGDGWFTFVIKADPADEVAEAWGDVKPLLLALIWAGFLTNAVVVISVWFALRPVDAIRAVLQRMQAGELQPALPQASTPELRGIVDGLERLGGTLAEVRADNLKLLRQCLDIQEEERRFIARELHDEFGQGVAAIDAYVALLQRRMQGQAHAADAAVGTAELLGIRASVSQLYDRLRALLSELRPAGLDEFGVGAALQNLMSEWRRCRPDIRFTDDIALGDLDWDPFTQTAVFRIAQEAMTNAVRHAGAREIGLTLSRERDGAVMLVVRDDGGGRLPTSLSPRSRGLRGMHERAGLIGAALDLHATVGRGTAVALRVPAH